LAKLCSYHQLFNKARLCPLFNSTAGTLLWGTLMLLLISATNAIASESPRQEMTLNGMGWHVWLDEKAEWAKDRL
jgi:hypothetical protein